MHEACWATGADVPYGTEVNEAPAWGGGAKVFRLKVYTIYNLAHGLMFP